MGSFYRGLSMLVLLAMSWGLFCIICGRLPLTTEAVLLGIISGTNTALLWYIMGEV